MERSQSYSSFEGSSNNNNTNNNISNNNNNNHNHISNTSSLLQAIEVQKQLLKQKQQLQLQILQQELIQQHQQKQQQQLLFVGQDEHLNEMLHRQELGRELSDEVDYAADLDEEAEDEEEEDNELERILTPEAANEVVEQHAASTAILPMTSHQKQQQFRQRKPQSAAALIMRATSTTSTTSSSASSNCCCSSSSSTAGSTTSSSSSANNAAERRRRLKHDSFDSAAPADSSPSPLRRNTAAAQLQRDNSVQSDSSRYSSVDSLLESRKPDPEVILINLGFGPIGSDILSRIPKRFLKPSQVHGIDTDAFVRRVQLSNTLADHSVLGYRGLTGNPDLPPSSIVAKIMKRFELYQRKKSMDSVIDLKRR